MATYDELRDLLEGNEGLRSKVVVAAVICAAKIVEEQPPATGDRLQWANDALGAPDAVTNQLYHFLIGENENAPIEVITGASDSVVQASVDKAIDILYPKV